MVDICASESITAKHSTSSINICASFTLPTRWAIGSELQFCFLIALRVIGSVWVGSVEHPAPFYLFDSGGKEGNPPLSSLKMWHTLCHVDPSPATITLSWWLIIFGWSNSIRLLISSPNIWVLLFISFSFLGPFCWEVPLGFPHVWFALTTATKSDTFCFKLTSFHLL